MPQGYLFVKIELPLILLLPRKERHHRTCGRVNPKSAIAWAGTISDQKRRDKTLVELVRDWNKRDPQGAQDYMERNQWPEEARKMAGKQG